MSRSTVSRAKRKYDAGGTAALVPEKRGRKGPTKIKGDKEKLLKQLYRAGTTQAEIARRLGVTEVAIHIALKRLGLMTARQQAQMDVETRAAKAVGPTPEDGECDVVEPLETPEPAALGDRTSEETTNEEVTSEETDSEETDSEERAVTDEDDRCQSAETALPVAHTSDEDPDNRMHDRAFARLGLLDDAAPLFGNRRDNRWAGLLLAVPILVTHGVSADAVKILGGIGPAFYGVRNTVMSFLLMFLARIGSTDRSSSRSTRRRRWARCWAWIVFPR